MVFEEKQVWRKLDPMRPSCFVQELFLSAYWLQVMSHQAVSEHNKVSLLYFRTEILRRVATLQKIDRK